MPKYHIYIRDEVDRLLQKEAKRCGVTPKDIVRMRVETMSAALKERSALDDINRCFDAIVCLFKLVENLAPEVGYQGGVMRASAIGSEKYTRSAESMERHFKSLAAAIKQAMPERPTHFEKEG